MENVNSIYVLLLVVFNVGVVFLLVAVTIGALLKAISVHNENLRMSLGCLTSIPITFGLSQLFIVKDIGVNISPGCSVMAMNIVFLPYIALLIDVILFVICGLIAGATEKKTIDKS